MAYPAVTPAFAGVQKAWRQGLRKGDKETRQLDTGFRQYDRYGSVHSYVCPASPVAFPIGWFGGRIGRDPAPADVAALVTRTKPPGLERCQVPTLCSVVAPGMVLFVSRRRCGAGRLFSTMAGAVMRLEGKVAFISGGARGMGAAEVRLFSAEGASVAFGDVLEEDGRALEAEIAKSGGRALFLHLDVTSADQWQSAIDATVARFGRLDVLVNNAGVRGAGLVEDISEEEWDRVLDINAKGTFLGTRAALPVMRRNGGGSIINISSQLGIVGVDNSGPQYQASKGAVRIFTKATAIQYATDGIRANSVHPGPIATPMTEGGRADPDRFRTTVSRIPLGRYGEPEDVAYGVLFLASDESSFMTGSELVIDGGWTAQ